jgi:amino acid adenylation domain-containing protein
MNKQLVHSVFEQVAHTQGGRIAVEHAATQVTYAELNGYANQIAHCLLSQQAAGQVVGAFFESSVAYVAAILGINKARGAFMPLEPDFPAKRLLFLLESARPAVVVTDAAHLALLLNLLGDPALAARPERIVVVSHSPGSLSVELLDPRGEDLPPAATDAANPGVALSGEAPNYIIYTSGSTGQPKLIEGCHKGLSHFIHWEIKEFALDASVRVSQLAPVSFDVSFRDIFVPLLTGGCLCIPPKDIRFQPAALLRWLHASRVSLMHCVPTVLRLLTEEIKNAPEEIALTEHLQYVLLAGEALYGKDVMNWRQAAGDRIELVNVYGPSETTLAKMFHRIPAVPVEPASIIPLGKAISNTLVMILKEDRLCEIGETGEIYIKTPFRSRGYYRNPALTGERFVQNPLNGDDPDIVYKTGDLGRYTDTMDVVFAGREDDQVKIRGNRVEVAEAERRLMGMPGVDRAVVRVYAREAGDEMLIGYYSAETSLPEKEIRTYLKDFLPEYMIPAAYVRVPDFPLNRNGKIDRQALPAPELGKADAYEAPENDLERKLEEIWKSVLNLPRVGRRESFFDIGGSSLKGIKIIARMLKTFEVMVKLPDLFANPTIAELASLLATALKKSFQEINPLPAGQPYYETSRAQQRLWILSQFQDNSVAYNVSYGYWLDGHLDADAFGRAVGALIERYEMLRTVFVLVDGVLMQKINPAAGHFSLAKLAFADDEAGREQVRQLADAEAATPFDLADGPLVRVKLVSLSAEKSALILTLHHIISDGWSMNVFFNDLLVAYESYRTGTEVPLKPLKFQYKDYAAWQNQLLSGAELRDHRDYWLGCFAGNLPLIDLPHDKPRPATKTHHGAIARLHVPAAVAAPLKKLAQQGEATLFMLLLASVKTLLHKYSGQEDLIIGIPVAGREHADLDNQIGLFVNTLAIRTALRPEEPFEKVLRSVKERTLGAYKHQAYPFDQLVDNLDLTRDLSRSVLFDVMVVLHDTRQAAMEVAAPSMNGVALRSIGIASLNTKFDMAFNFAESEGGINLRLEYNTDLFSPARIEAVFGHYLTLLTAIAARPDTPVGLLSLLPAAESEAILRRDRNTIEGPYAGSSVEQFVRYGRLKAGYQFYIGDSYGALRPEGLAGDLYIACDAAAVPAAFAAEPHPSDPGRVLIRTGERGRLLGDVVRYLGPSSAEHPLNGRWINLEYIASHLRRFAGVESATVAIAGRPGEKQRLMAWLTGDEQPDSGELTDYLALHLAAHMVPEHFIFRADGQLPVPDADWNQWLPAAGEDAPRAYVPPRNPVEAQLSVIVAEVMGKGQMSIEDNFFEAGFHSLKAIRLAAQVCKEMNVRLSLKTILMHPTIGQLGREIENLNWLNKNPTSPDEDANFLLI